MSSNPCYRQNAESAAKSAALLPARSAQLQAVRSCRRESDNSHTYAASRSASAQRLQGVARGHWTAYAIGNARCLACLPQVSSHDWNLLTGLATGVQSLVLLPIAMALGSDSHEFDAWAFRCRLHRRRDTGFHRR